jgi:hypothetical protein
MAPPSGPRFRRTIGALLSVEHLAHLRHGRLLPIPDLACRPLAMSAVRHLAVGEYPRHVAFAKWSNDTCNVCAADAVLFLSEAPVNISRLNMDDVWSDDLGRVAVALSLNACHGFLSRLTVKPNQLNTADRRALVEATDRLRFLRRLDLECDDDASIDPTTLLQGSAATIRRVRQIGSSATVLDWSPYPRLVDLAFVECRRMESTVLPVALTRLRDSSFAASAITAVASDPSVRSSVALPPTLRTVGNNVFSRCDRLVRVDLSHSGIATIGSGFASNCAVLATVAFPTTLTFLGRRSFEGCPSLERLDLARTCLVRCPSNLAFRCASLNEVSLPATVADIGSDALRSCHALTSVELSHVRHIQRIGTALSHCSSLVSLDLAHTELTLLGDYCLGHCTALARLLLPACLVKIGAEALVNCLALRELDLAHTAVRTVGRGFLKWSRAIGPMALSSMLMPASLQAIGHNSFHGCGALLSLDLSHTAVTTVANLCDYVNVTFPSDFDLCAARKRLRD